MPGNVRKKGTMSIADATGTIPIWGGSDNMKKSFMSVDDSGFGREFQPGKSPTSHTSVPEPSFSGPSSVGGGEVSAHSEPNDFEPDQDPDDRGMGGTRRPTLQARAERQMTPQEMMDLSNRMIADMAAQSAPRPSAVEPTLERMTNTPFWLRQYADQEGLDKTNPYQDPEKARMESIMARRR